jgi:predicted AAA+ superfamily ATPase
MKYVLWVSHGLAYGTIVPWHRNEGKRLVRSPKVYVRDSGGSRVLTLSRSQLIVVA